jgi:endoglucanase
LANSRGLYIIVDWHILNPGDPSDPIYLNAGLDLPLYKAIRKDHPDYTGPQLFFAYLSDKYGDLPNILFEIANEPNRNGREGNATVVWKEKLLPYSQKLVDAIRAYDGDGKKDNIVICGTDNWSQYVNAPVANPVKDKNGQIMYTMHFYAGTHDAGKDGGSFWLRKKVLNALDGDLASGNAGIAVFCTEWGTSLASGDGGPFINYAERWLEFLDDNKISWCSWSLARKPEVSSSTVRNTSDHPTDTDGDGIKNWDWNTELSITGRFVRAKIRGDATPLYTAPDGTKNNGDVSFLPDD